MSFDFYERFLVTAIPSSSLLFDSRNLLDGLSRGPFKYFDTALDSVDVCVVLPRYFVTAMPSSSESRNLVTVVSRYLLTPLSFY